VIASGLALLAAIGFAGAAISSKRGLTTIGTLGGLAISLPAGLIVLLAAAIYDWPPAIPWSAVPWLILAGLLGSAVGRLLMIAGLRRLNSTVYVPIQTSTHPIVAVIGGGLLLSEPIGWLRIVGVLVIIVGIWYVTRGAGRARQPLALGAEVREMTARRGIASTALLLPVGAGLMYGGSDLTIDVAMTVLPYPAFGAAIGLLAACLVWGGIFATSPVLRRQLSFGKGKLWFIVQGLVTAMAVLCAYAALERGDVSAVSPIIASQPCWALLLSALMLRDIERVNTRVVIGSLASAGGAVIISLS
jgi:drug/metabolite transporter (DMT)-like permease